MLNFHSLPPLIRTDSSSVAEPLVLQQLTACYQGLLNGHHQSMTQVVCRLAILGSCTPVFEDASFAVCPHQVCIEFS